MIFSVRRLLVLLQVAAVVVHAQNNATADEEMIDCTAMLAVGASGKSETCEGLESGTNGHYFPLGDTSGCHGWRAYDNNGKLHDNSATNMRCSEDGTALLYDQFANSIDCSPSDETPVAESKSFILNECHQGKPPTLYDMAINLDCCTDPEGDSCKNTYTGIPRADNPVTTGDVAFWNGKQCKSEADDKSSPDDESSGTDAPDDTDDKSTSAGESLAFTSSFLVMAFFVAIGWN